MALARTLMRSRSPLAQRPGRRATLVLASLQRPPLASLRTGGLIDEDQPPGIEIGLLGEPGAAAPAHVGAVLLGGVAGFFCA